MDEIRRLRSHAQQYAQGIFHRRNRISKKENIEFTTRIRSEYRRIIWRIENMSGCVLKVGEYIESPLFYTGFTEVTNWCLRLYPQGKESKELVGMFLCKISPFTRNFVTVSFTTRKKVKLDSSLVIGTQDFTSPRRIYEKPEEIGTNKFMLSKNLLSLDSLEIICDINVGYVDKARMENFTSGISAVGCDCVLSVDFEKLQNSGTFTDATVEVQEKKFPVHKSILAARSACFAAMFEHEMKENKTNTVIIKNVISAPNFARVLQHIYTGKINDMSVEEAVELYRFADMYQLSQLKNDCVCVMIENMSVNNVCQIAILADVYDVSELKNATNFIFRNHLIEIMHKKSKEWESLIDTRPQLAGKVLNLVESNFTTKFPIQIE